MPKIKTKSTQRARMQARKRMALNRENPETREKQRIVDAEAHRLARQDSERRKAENRANAESHRKARLDQDRRIAERIADANAHKKARQDVNRRDLEKRVDANAHKKARQDVNRRDLEKRVDAEAHREARKDKQRREAERRVDAQAHKKTRQDINRRELENRMNAEAHKKAREAPKRRHSESKAKAETYIKRRKLNNSNYLLEKYNEKIRRAPTFICSCCGGLFYEESVSSTSEVHLRAHGFTEAFIKTVLIVRQVDHLLCGTCKTSKKHRRVPKLCLSNGFDFPVIPPELKDLSPLEERLVALRLPFMQVRLVGSERQSVLRGNVVNVENDLDVTAKTLPRNFDETSTQGRP